jgi:cytochrome c oxidase subunit IV
MTHDPHSLRPYVLVWLVLLTLTFTTVWVAEIELGEWNVVVAITIAVIKALLVVLFFMHVKGSSAMTKLFVGAGLFWFAILVALTFGDYHSRGWITLQHWL